MSGLPFLSEFIREQLRQRGWSGIDFGVMIGCNNPSAVSKIINGKQPPSLHQLPRIAAMFDVPVDDVLKMRLTEELAELPKTDVGDADYFKLIETYKVVPIAELIKRGWVSVRDKKDPAEILTIFEPMVPELKKMNGLAHKTGEGTPYTDVQKAWIFHVSQLAKRILVPPYCRSLALQAIEKLHRVMVSRADVCQIFDILRLAGIRLVFVECPRSKIDGVCTWIDKESPVIGMTLRFDREDNFWFVLRHELEHVLQGYEERAQLDDDILANVTKNPLEIRANEAAQEFCAPSALTDQFILKSNGRFVDEEAIEFAKQNNLLPSALAGQIRHKLARYNILNKLLLPIRKQLIEVAPVVDGWGRIPV
jgi:HTH-type transcriptional regulator/antitoxin HigA